MPGLEARLERPKGTRRQVVGYFESRAAWRSTACSRSISIGFTGRYAFRRQWSVVRRTDFR
jgi:hypothetical protein